MIVTDKSFLSKPSEDVLQEEVDNLISLLEKELDNSALLGRPGIGLAAPQIGIHKKAAIIRIQKNGYYDLTVNLINAKIEKFYDPITFKNEGCLSFPDDTVDTTRYNEIYVTNNLVYPHSFIATGLMAVAIQHELDHVNGITMFDRAIKPKVKVGPNEPCICGSNKKFKKCCGK